MRIAFVLLVAIMILALALFVPVARTAKGQAEPLPKLTTTVYAGAGGTLIFVPAQILIPQVPIILNITVINNGTSLHTFSINDQNPDLQVDVSLQAPGDRGSVEFQVNESEVAQGAIGMIYYNGSSFSPQLTPNGIRFYCIPHVDFGMVGEIVLASAGTGVTPEKGFFLRAYWIGVIGIVAMLGWVGITYFVIKSSSRHFTDHHEHIRRGLP